MTRVGVVGSRDFDNINLMHVVLQKHLPADAIIVSGGAKGADTLAREYAKEHEIPYEEILPDWKRSGKKAAVMRNSEIVSSVDFVVAFWDGKSKGTFDTIKKTKGSNKRLVLIEYNTQK